MADLWTVKGKPHDTSCLICFCSHVDLGCLTCERSYHTACIEEDFPTDIVNNAWWCLLCIKRSWNKISPTKKGNERVFAMAHSFANDSMYLQQVQVFDDGSLFSDHKLLSFLRKLRYVHREGDEQVRVSAIGKLFRCGSRRASSLSSDKFCAQVKAKVLARRTKSNSLRKGSHHSTKGSPVNITA